MGFCFTSLKIALCLCFECQRSLTFTPSLVAGGGGMPRPEHVYGPDFMADRTVVVGSLKFHLLCTLVTTRCSVVDWRQLGQGQKTQLYTYSRP